MNTPQFSGLHKIFKKKSEDISAKNSEHIRPSSLKFELITLPPLDAGQIG